MDTVRAYILFTGFALSVSWGCAWLISLGKSRDVFLFYGFVMTAVFYLLPMTVVAGKALRKRLRADFKSRK